MSDLLSNIPGLQVHIDDILIPGSTLEEHDKRLHEVLRRLRKAKPTLNPAKCEFRKKQITFLGHIINSEGIRLDPGKTEAIRKLPAPTSVMELRRFMGMVNQFNKFSPQIMELAKPLRELLSPKNVFMSPTHEEAFTRVK